MENQESLNEKVSEQVDGMEKSKKSRKRNKNKKAPENEKNLSETVNINESNPVVGSSQGSGNTALTQTLDQEFLNKVKNMRIDEVMKLSKDSIGQAGKVYKFWSTQPVPQMSEEPALVVAAGGEGTSDDHKAIEPDKAISEIRPDPYPLPEGFIWETMDLNNEVVLRELYTLLNENYVEDDDAMFRFDYQPEFLRWALQPPKWLKDWHVG